MRFVLVVVAACGGHPSSPTPQPEPTRSIPHLLQQVGPKPRGYATVAITEGWIRSQLEQASAVLPGLTGKTLADCKIDLDELARVRIAIGEPLRVAAELDGQIDVAALTCVIGDAGIDALANVGIVIRDRAGGIALDYNVQRGAPRDAAAIAARCATASCVAVRFGPPARSVWASASFGRTMRFQLDGPGIGAAGVALIRAVDKLRATVPALASIELDVHGDVLAFDAANEPDEQMAAALKEHLIEAFRIPSSSMVPTLQIGDHVFAVKGPLLGPLTPGDIFVYRNAEDRDYIFRYITAGPHTVTESEAGIAVDGKVLPRQVVAASATYRDEDYLAGEAIERSGSIVREHAGARSYLTFRSGPPRQPGPWNVPEGTLFFVGDNRNNANDSRNNDPTPVGRLRGRAIAIWWASRDGVPDWERIGTPIE